MHEKTMLDIFYSTMLANRLAKENISNIMQQTINEIYKLRLEIIRSRLDTDASKMRYVYLDQLDD